VLESFSGRQREWCSRNIRAFQALVVGSIQISRFILFFAMVDHPANLTRSGVIAWNKLSDRQKTFAEQYLRSSHFTSYEHYDEFITEQRISPLRKVLLDGCTSHYTERKLIDNLCKVIADLQKKIEELESEKQDKPYDCDW
jgi:hypothetical protein